MALIAAVNIRATSGYVSDGVGETYSLGEAYPITRGGYTFGWSGDYTANARDRSDSVDRRLAGLVFRNTIGNYFQIDLGSAGQHDIQLAMGDAADTNSTLWDICDTDTVLASITGDPITAFRFKDATNTEYTAANWVTTQAAVRFTFSTNVLRIKVRAVGGGGQSVLAHVRVDSVAAPAYGGRTLKMGGVVPYVPKLHVATKI